MTLDLIYKIKLMSSKIKILQVIPRLGYGGAETGCYDLANYLPEQKCKSFIVTSGGPLVKFINKIFKLFIVKKLQMRNFRKQLIKNRRH